MISMVSPTLTLPPSIRPVTTVPRPVIENTSSIGMMNGLSNARSGSSKNSSTVLINSSTLDSHSSSPSSALSADTRTIGVSASNS